jgi:type IV pilus assembly protein PilM
LPEYLKKIINEAEIKGKEAYVAIPAFGGLITLIDFPQMIEKDLEQAIRFEANKYIPTSLDEIVLSWEIVKNGNDLEAVKNPENKSLRNIFGEKKTEKKDKVSEKNARTEVLLVASSKKQIIDYEKAVKSAGLKVRGVEIESIAMINSLIGNDLGNFIIVDIGARICNIIYIEKGIIKINRNIDAGGEDFTRVIEKSVGVSGERAEMMKKSEKNFFSPESNIHFSTLDSITSEISGVIETLARWDEKKQIESIVLSGGTAQFNGLAEFFQNKFNIKTIIGNPFGRIDYDKKLESTLGMMKGQFSVCLGLALSGIQNFMRKK